MAITYVKGDLFTTTDKIIVHGCNSHGIMGSGVAKIVKDKFPEAFEEYERACRKHVKSRNVLLGTNVYALTQDGNRHIVNAITQLDMGPAPHRWVSYDAVDDCMWSLAKDLTAVGRKGEPISMPQIGAGLGGGNWMVIEAIVASRLQDFPVNVYIL